MISILTSGVLIAKPVRRISKGTSREFVTAQLRVSSDNENYLVSVICFNDDFCRSLLALDKNDALSVAGPGKPTTWTSKDRTPATGLSVVAQQIMTAYRLREKRKAMTESKTSFLPAQSPLLSLDGDEDGAPF